jgi:hypothetical protein
VYVTSKLSYLFIYLSTVLGHWDNGEIYIAGQSGRAKNKTNKLVYVQRQSTLDYHVGIKPYYVTI